MREVELRASKEAQGTQFDGARTKGVTRNVPRTHLRNGAISIAGHAIAFLCHRQLRLLC